MLLVCLVIRKPAIFQATRYTTQSFILSVDYLTTLRGVCHDKWYDKIPKKKYCYSLLIISNQNLSVHNTCWSRFLPRAPKGLEVLSSPEQAGSLWRASPYYRNLSHALVIFHESCCKVFSWINTSEKSNHHILFGSLMTLEVFFFIPELIFVDFCCPQLGIQNDLLSEFFTDLSEMSRVSKVSVRLYLVVVNMSIVKHLTTFTFLTLPRQIFVKSFCSWARPFASSSCIFRSQVIIFIITHFLKSVLSIC